MKAVRFHENGGPEVLRYEDAEQPVAAEGQVLIRVAGSAFNPADAGIRGGTLPFPVSLPHVPGYDVSGTVEVLGAGVTGFQVGDAVVGFIPMAADGSAAEYVAAPASALVTAPSSIDLADAAALPSVALTAWQALFDLAGLQSDQRVLITVPADRSAATPSSSPSAPALTSLRPPARAAVTQSLRPEPTRSSTTPAPRCSSRLPVR